MSVVLKTLLDKLRAGESPAAALSALSEGVQREVEVVARARLDELPLPIGPRVSGEQVDERRAIEQLLGELRSARGDHALKVRAARDRWLSGGGHVAYLEALRESGRTRDAAALCRALLSQDGVRDREGIEAFLARVSQLPDGWDDALEALARAPTLDGFDALFRFTPEEVEEERLRYSLRRLRELNTEPAMLFAFATRLGVTPDAIALIEEGEVAPRVVEERARQSTAAGRAIWLGLAARAACMQGDRLGTVRLLREAQAASATEDLVATDIAFIREQADEELLAMLEKAGF